MPSRFRFGKGVLPPYALGRNLAKARFRRDVEYLPKIIEMKYIIQSLRLGDASHGHKLE